MRRKDDFLTLFIRREWKVILGRKFSNLWLIAAMMTATFLAISFSNASLRYLSDKMNDPFIKWVDIKNTYGQGDFVGLSAALGDYENMEKFDYNSYQSDYYFSYMFFGKEKNMIQYFQCRFFEDLKTDLLSAILSKDNLVGKNNIESIDALPEETIGVIITRSALLKLGFDDAPVYLDLCHYSDGADSLGFELYSSEFARAPIPVLAVVKRLPSNVDVIASKFVFEQENNDDTYPFNFACNRQYSESLRYFIPNGVDRDAFVSDLEAAATNSSVKACVDEYSFYKPEIAPAAAGVFISLVGEDDEPLIPMETAGINERIMSSWQANGVCRVYDYNFAPYEVKEKSYLSVYFNSLGHVKDFEDFVNEYKVKIDMSQINSKENFNAVSMMGNVLSWSIVVFAIVCIILFIVNLLQSYFQKVKKNIGTFKAFGVSNERLIRIYVIIVGATIVAAVVISLSMTLLAQVSFDLMGVLREGTYNYLDIWSPKTLASVLIILAASVVTVFAVITRMLRQTPGDLIYDRQ